MVEGAVPDSAERLPLSTLTWGQLYGAQQLCMTEQLLLVILYDEVMKYSYMNTRSVE